MHNFNWYVAGPWLDRPNVREIITKIEAAGYQTCSRWAEIDNPDVAEDDPERVQKLRDQAMRDVEDVIMADGLIYVNSLKSEGKATELGISIAMLKPIIIIGGRETNIFLNINIPAYPTIEEALEWLKDEGMAYIAWVTEQRMTHLQRMGSTVVPHSIADMVFPSE